jgi:hypothetical protein
MRPTRTIAAALLFLLPLACGNDDDATDVSADDTGTGAPVEGEPGGGEGPLFIEIAVVGGFVPQDFAFKNVPTAVVYDDGTVIAPGATAAIYPGPAALPLFSGTVDDDVLDDLLQAAGEAGMVGGTPDVGEMGAIPVADAASTRVTVVVDGDEQVVEAYALDVGADLGQVGLSEAQLASRAALSDLVAAVSEVVNRAATEELPVERYRVQAGPPVDPAGLDPNGPQPNDVVWPDGLPEPVEGECVAITGDDVAPFAAALEQANELSQWHLGDRVFSLVVRPVLPHEPDCPA